MLCACWDGGRAERRIGRHRSAAGQQHNGAFILDATRGPAAPRGSPADRGRCSASWGAVCTRSNTRLWVRAAPATTRSGRAAGPLPLRHARRRSSATCRSPRRRRGPSLRAPGARPLPRRARPRPRPRSRHSGGGRAAVGAAAVAARAANPGDGRGDRSRDRCPVNGRGCFAGSAPFLGRAGRRRGGSGAGGDGGFYQHSCQTRRREMQGELRLRGLHDRKRSRGATEVEQATAVGGDVLVVASVRADEAAEFVVAATQPAPPRRSS